MYLGKGELALPQGTVAAAQQKSSLFLLTECEVQKPVYVHLKTNYFTKIHVHCDSSSQIC